MAWHLNFGIVTIPQNSCCHNQSLAKHFWKPLSRHSLNEKTACLEKMPGHPLLVISLIYPCAWQLINLIILTYQLAPDNVCLIHLCQTLANSKMFSYATNLIAQQAWIAAEVQCKYSASVQLKESSAVHTITKLEKKWFGRLCSWFFTPCAAVLCHHDGACSKQWFNF